MVINLDGLKYWNFYEFRKFRNFFRIVFYKKLSKFLIFLYIVIFINVSDYIFFVLKYIGFCKG